MEAKPPHEHCSFSLSAYRGWPVLLGGFMSYRTCDHLKEDGVLCGSPALRGKKLCYFHQRDHKRTQYAAGVIRRADVLGPRLPRMNSLGDVQAALAEVWTALATRRVPLQRASARLFNLQQAAISLREPRLGQGLVMQPLTAEDFGHNSFASNCLRAFPAIPMKTNILADGGRGVRVTQPA